MRLRIRRGWGLGLWLGLRLELGLRLGLKLLVAARDEDMCRSAFHTDDAILGWSSAARSWGRVYVVAARSWGRVCVVAARS